VYPVRTDSWLTIVTVVRNDGPALQQTIASVVAQSVTGVDYLILDGASTDTTADIAVAATKRHEWIRTISEPDDGIYDAMNKGFATAQGEWVYFLNAGDRFRSEGELAWLAAQLPNVRSGWFRSPVQFVDADGTPTRPLRTASLEPQGFGQGRQDVFHQGTVMTKLLLQRLGGFNTRFAIAADFDLMNRALELGLRPKVSDHVLVDVDASGVSTQQWRRSLIEVHQARTANADLQARLLSRGQTALRVGEIAARRTVRHALTGVIGQKRYGAWRSGRSGESKSKNS